MVRVAWLGVGVALLEPFAPGAGALGVLVMLCVVGAVVLEHTLRLAPNARRPHGAVEVTRNVKRTLDLGETEVVSLDLRNHLASPVEVSLVESLPEGLETVLPFDELFPLRVRVEPLSRKRVSYEVRAVARGPAPIPGPWLRVGVVRGLALHRERPAVLSEPRVVPARKAIVRYDTLRRSRNLAALGIHVGAGFTRGREFDHMREYHVDDDFRDIDWKATARRDRPISRVYRPERSQDVIVAVDASRTMTARAGGLSKLDEAINAALVLAHVVSQGGDRFGLVVYDSEVRHYGRPAGGQRVVTHALDALYAVRSSSFDASIHAAATAIATRQSRRALVVFLTDLPDAVAGAEFVRCLPLLRRRHLVACFTVADHPLEALAESHPSDARSLARTLAGAEMLAEKRRARGLLRQAGTHCAELPPGDLAAGAVNRYLDAKMRGLL